MIWTFKLSAQLTIINRDNLRLIVEVESKIEQLRYEVEKAQRELNSLTLKLDNLKTLSDQAEDYFALMDKAARTPAEELRLKMNKPVLDSNNIISRSDFEYLKSVIDDTEPKAAHLKENFEKCSRLYELYADIAKTYYEISRGDYISRLVEEKRRVDDMERKKLNRKSPR